MNSEAKLFLAQELHEDEWSRLDNTDKTPVLIDNGFCPESGRRFYDLHYRRELHFTDREMLDRLTGRNVSNPSKTNRPHPTWEKMQVLARNKNDMLSIKGSTKLIRKCKCKCLKRKSPSQCSCPKCTRATEAVRVWHKYRKVWRKQLETKRKDAFVTQEILLGRDKDAIEEEIRGNPSRFKCKECGNGECWNVDSKYANSSTALSMCMNNILCKKVR